MNIQSKPDYFDAVSPESFTYPPSLRVALEKKREYWETDFLNEVIAGTAEQGEARQMWLQNIENMDSSINQMLENVDTNSLHN